MAWDKQPAIESGGVACMTCGCGAHGLMDLERLLAVGFGGVNVTRDGESVYSEAEATEKDAFWQGKDAESAAMKDPDHDWRVEFFAPLYEAEYQRQSEGHWVLIRKGDGFA